jgi:PIN domain nuclease of toxin-antitoxin system
MASAVLDSSAVLAVLNAERGADTIIVILNDAVLCSVNYAEVVTKLVERGVNLDDIETAMRLITSTVVDFDISLARRTGTLRAETSKHGLSLGDRACLALAERESLPAITGDRNLIGSVKSIEIQLFL